MGTRLHFLRHRLALLALLLPLLLAACGGGGGGGDNPTPQSYTIGGSVTGLAGSGLVLQNNGGDDLAIGSDGAFTFAGKVTDGGAYNVTVFTQPTNPSQTCSIANGSGTMAGADVGNVVITCATDTFTVGGSVTGLAGSGLVLQNNGADDLAIGSDGAFTFAGKITDGGAYSVTVLTQPTNPSQTCSVTNGGGTVSDADVANVSVTCVTDTFTISVTAEPAVAGTASGAGDYLPGEDITLLARAYMGYRFVNWTENGNEVSTNASYGFTASTDRSLVANFEQLAATPNLDFMPGKVFRFTWTDVPGATHYRLLENPDGASGFTQVSGDINQGTGNYDHVVPVLLHARLNAEYVLQTCNAYGCADSAPVNVSGTLASAIGYFKASDGSGTGNQFGYAVALSRDGRTLAVGAIMEDSAATGVNGNETDDCGASTPTNCARDSGAVYVFTRSDAGWTQQAYIKASNTGLYDQFGMAVALSADGNTLAVGAWREDSAATGINGNETDDCGASTPTNCARDSGAVYVFTRSSGTWTQQAYVKASNTDASDYFGRALALSGDGNTLTVGAWGEDSSATGINGNQAEDCSAGIPVNCTLDSGAVYVFTRSSGTWTQQAYVKASNTGASDWFGGALTLSSDGNTLAVGASGEDSAATGTNGNETDDCGATSPINCARNSGAVYVFTRSSGTWTQQAYLKASNTEASDWFGEALTLSNDSNTLAVGSSWEDGGASGINGNPMGTAPFSGAVYLFTHNGSDWSQSAYLKASNTDSSDVFGFALDLSGDGQSLAVGAPSEDSNANGIGGDQSNNDAPSSGAVYLY